MFEFGRDLRRRFAADKPSVATRDGLTRGDTALLELLDLDLLQAEAKAADIAAGRVSVPDAPAARLTAAGVWREVARRTGDPVALRRAAAHAQGAREDFEKAHRGPDAARARCEQAACGLIGAELFGDDALNAAAAVTLKVAAAQTGVGAALAQAMLAGIEGRRVLAKGDAAEALKAAVAFETPIAALTAAGRRSSQARLAAAEHRLVRAEMLVGCAARLQDRDLAVEALAQLKTVIQSLDAAYEPLLWARAQGLRGVALAALGEMEADVGLIADGVEALADALEGAGRDHSPLDWARAQAMLGTGLQIMGEASTSERAFEKAVSCFDRAILVLKGQPALSLSAHVAGSRAACLARCAELTGDLAVLDAAEAAFRAELSNRSAVADPVAWAICQTNLARLYEARADLTGKDNGQRAAAAVALAAAFDVFAEQGMRSLSDMALTALERVRSY
jgi:tetratricopeptide (TPR) repeat protein